MSGRFTKHSGALLLDSPAGKPAPTGPLRRFKPDFYIPPPERPARQPNFNPNPRTPPPGGFGRRQPTPRPTPGHRLGPGRAVSYAGVLWWAVEYVDGYYLSRPEYGRYKTPPGGWRECVLPCYTPPATGWHTLGDTMYFCNQYYCSQPPCLSGQAPCGTVFNFGDDVVYSGTSTVREMFYRYTIGSGINRGKTHRGWTRSNSNVGPHTWKFMVSAWLPRDDPNDKRSAPSPVPFPPPSSGHAPGGGSPPPAGEAPPGNRNPKRPKRPERGTKERKQKTKLTTMFKILDILSETAELVGAFYDALPQSVKDKWKCDKLKRGLLDNAGQYGISGADCKSRALWHNWHKVDMEQGIRNAIKNELQDKFLGALNRAQPKNIGHASDDAMREVNKLFEQVMEELGL